MMTRTENYAKLTFLIMNLFFNSPLIYRFDRECRPLGVKLRLLPPPRLDRLDDDRERFRLDEVGVLNNFGGELEF
jgi:hypothetical protein